MTKLPCHHCAALREIPTVHVGQWIGYPPDAVGVSFDTDVIKRTRQLVLPPGECVSSLLATTMLEGVRYYTLRDALIHLCVHIPPLITRTDPVPGFKASIDDQLLKHHRITPEIGNAKNHNRNPVAERAAQEAHRTPLT